MLLSCLNRPRPSRFAAISSRVEGAQLQWTTDRAGHSELDWLAMDNPIAGKRLPHPLAQRRIIGFPDDAAHCNGGQIDAALPQDQFDPIPHSTFRIPNFRNPPSLLVLLGVSLVKHDPVARLNDISLLAQFQLHQHAARRLAHDGADAHPAAFGKSALNEDLMVDAAEETMAEAP